MREKIQFGDGPKNASKLSYTLVYLKKHTKKRQLFRRLHARQSSAADMREKGGMFRGRT